MSKNARLPKIKLELGAGHDSLYIGVAGADITINAGQGNDSIAIYDAAKAVVYGGDGNDWLTDYSGHATLFGGAGNDLLTATGKTTLVGGAGADRFMVMNDWMHNNAAFEVVIKQNDFNPLQGDILDLTGLGSWDNSGFTPLPQDRIFLYHDDLLITRQDGRVDAIENVGMIALVGISTAIEKGWLVLDANDGKG